ncbi:uncharacterized protein LOC130712217 [Lotus japonicus]|uniref:uncharacterized protein LOC130712217 n=1 Tax=Lotus japonicus TaxID=34305 RepID=UPI00258AF797|nr:uncharacterized protein LOC130712217 [Lotus japonicus]
MASSTNSVFSYTTSQITVFNGEHYDYWSSQMETIFLSQDLWDVVEEKYEELSDQKTADWTDVKEKEYKENVKKNATTLRIIQQGVNKAIYPRIFGIKKGKEAWETLKTEFQGSTKVIAIKLQYLWSEFENLTMKEETKDLSKLTQYVLMGSLEAHEQRVNKYNNQPSEQVFQAKQNLKNSKSQQGGQYRGQPSSRGRGGRQFEISDRGKGRRDSSWQCKIPNHSDRDCWHKRENDGKQNAINYSAEDETYKLFLSVTDDIKSGEKWYFDSGCSNYVTGNQNAFEVLDKNFSSVVELGDGKKVKIQGKCAIAIHTSEGNKKVIDDKSEAFTMFLHFKAFAEKQSGYEIKTLRTDRGGEFIHKPFINYCKEQGIQRQLTIRYTPQQNGVAERKNRTTVEMARSMLKGKELPNKFWAEAVSSAAYILNRSHTKAVQNKTPFEA